MFPFPRQQLMSFWIALLFGMATLGESHRRLFSSELPKIDTEMILQKLDEQRMLGMGKDMRVGSPMMMDMNIDVDSMDLQMAGTIDVPPNGCTICQGNTLLSNKIPNQNLFPEFAFATCQQWQDVILPEISPDWEDCASHNWYQMLFVSCCQLALSRFECEQNVHDFHATFPYNTAVPPVMSSWDKPLKIKTELVFDWMEKLVVEEGTATIHLTQHLRWKDPRLSWTVDAFTCADYVSVPTSYSGDSPIWRKHFCFVSNIVFYWLSH